MNNEFYEGALLLCSFGWFILLFNLKKHKTLYWIGLLALYAQSLFWFFHFDLLSSSTSIQSMLWYIGDEFSKTQFSFLLLSIFPFILPVFLSWLTGTVTESFSAALVVLTFFSIVEVIVRGKLSGQDNWGNKLFSIAKMALPLISLLAAVINMLNKFG